MNHATDTLQLVLIAPRMLEDALLDALLAAQPALDGFGTLRIDGHAEDFRRASVRELVRGRIERTQFTLVLPAARVAQLLDALGTRFQGAGLHWWTTPVTAHGRLA